MGRTITTMSSDPATAIWSATEVFQARHEKSAGALIAVQSALRSGRLAGERTSEFFSLYRFCVELPNWIFTRVWCEPGAYAWVRVAYDLVGHLRHGGELPSQACAYLKALAGENPAAWLPRHLEEFAPFALAGAVLAGRPLHLQRAYRARLPLALPGTSIQLTGEGSVRIKGYRPGALLIANEEGTRFTLRLHSGAEAGGVHVIEDPQLDCGANRIRLSSAPFNLPGFEFAAQVLPSDAAYHRRHLPLLRAAFEHVARHHPETYAQMGASLRVIGLKPYGRGDFTNMTHSDLPGAFVLSVVENPWELADTIIHEFHHNRLFFIEEDSPFFADPDQDAASDEQYYSPWRDDLRPLTGVLHAVYVHLPVCDYWASVLQTSGVERSVRACALDRLTRYPRQIAVGLQQLRRFGRVTEAGHALLEQLEQRLGQVRRRLAALPAAEKIPAYLVDANGKIVVQKRADTGAPMSVLEALQEHRRRCDTLQQCRDADFDQLPAA